jgi:hypothetical protein
MYNPLTKIGTVPLKPQGSRTCLCKTQCHDTWKKLEDNRYSSSLVGLDAVFTDWLGGGGWGVLSILIYSLSRFSCGSYTWACVLLCLARPGSRDPLTIHERQSYSPLTEKVPVHSNLRDLALAYVEQWHMRVGGHMEEVGKTTAPHRAKSDLRCGFHRLVGGWGVFSLFL